MKKIYFLSLISFLFTSNVFSQDEFVNNGGQVTVESNALLYVKGEVRGQGAATIDLAGTLFISTDNVSLGQGELEWNSSSTFNNTNGKIQFSGIGDAKIHGTGTNITTGTLDVNIFRLVGSINEAEATVDKFVTVSNLKLQGGIVRVGSAYDLFVNNTSTTAITDSSLAGFKWGDKESSFVIGKLKRAVNSTGNYAYPVGSDLRGYNRYDLLLDGAPAGTNAVTLEFEDITGTPGFVTPLFIATGDCSGPSFIPFQAANPNYVDIDQMVPDFGMWKVRATNQASTSWSYGVNAYPNLNNSTVQASFNGAATLHLIKGADNADVNSDWSQWVYDSGILCSFANYDNTNLRGSIYNGYPVVDYIPARNLTGFSNFGVGRNGSGSGLPVELISLRADPVNNKFIRVSWATATETNNAGFEVYRSEDGVNFENIGWVDGAGNSSTQNNYSHNDHDVVANKVYYYRLRQVDFDGASETTHIVSAMITAEGVFVISEFIPNPADNATSLIITSSDTRDVNVTFYNTLGQLISNNSLVIQKGENRFDFNLSDFAAGTYHSLITAGDHSFNKKIVVTR